MSTRVEARAVPAVSVVVPTLNEVDNLDPLISALLRAFGHEPYDFEILIADGGSKDGTRERARAWSANDPVRLIECTSGRGLAGDVIEATRAARADVVVVLDADLSHPPDRAPMLASRILDGTADMAIGSRYCPGGSTPGWPFKRRLMSRTAGWIVRPFQDAHDPMAGFFAVRRERLLAAGTEARGFKIGLEILLHGGDSLRIAEIPIEFRDRRYGSSKLGANQVRAYLGRIVRVLGGAEAPSALIRYGWLAALAACVDLLVVWRLLAGGTDLVGAHLGGFAADTLVNYLGITWWGSRSTRAASGVTGWRGHARFVAVAAFALSLRGAVLALLARAGWNPLLPLVAAIFAGASVSWLGNVFYVRSATAEPVASGLRWRMAVVGVCAFLLALRLCYLGLPPLLIEEAYYWNYAQHPALSYLDHPPLVALSIHAGTSVFGDTEFGVRAPAFVASLVLIAFGYRMASDLFGRAAGLRTALLLTALPSFFAYGLLMTPDSLLHACWAGTLYFLQRALVGGRRGAWYGVGVCLGLGLLAKYTIVLLVPATLLFVLVHKPSRAWLARKEPYLALAIALAIFSPVIVWNAENGWASFAFQGSRRLSSEPTFGLPVLLLGSIPLVLGPTAAIAALLAIVPSTSMSRANDRSDRSGVTFSRVLLVLPLSVFVAFSLVHEPKLNWTSPVWLAIVPLVAFETTTGDPVLSRARRLVARAWAPTIAGLAVTYGVLLHYWVLGIPGLAYPVNSRLFGWEDLAAQIETIEDDLEAKSGAEPLVVGMDRFGVASELTFYRTKVLRGAHVRSGETVDHEAVLETTGRHLFGKESLMYGYWWLGGSPEGRTLILVGTHPDNLSDDLLAAHFAQITPVLPIDTEHNGRASTKFFYRIGYGFGL